MPVSASRHHEWAFGGGLMLLLCLLVATASTPPAEARDGIVVSVDVVDGPGAEREGALFLPTADPRPTRARLRFTLPPEVEAAATDWTLWFGREPLDRLQVSMPGWSPPAHEFFRPDAAQGDRPLGYAFQLPASARGSVVVDVVASTHVRTALRPKIMRSGASWSAELRPLAMVMAVYASLFTLSMLALALFSAARDRSFLSFFAYAASTLFLLAAGNGHLYMLPVLSGFGLWRSQGIWALCALFVAAWLQVLLRYAGTAEARPQYARWVDRYCVAMIALAGVCLLNQAALAPWMQRLSTLAYVIATAMSLAILVDAVRRHVRMAWINLLLLLVTIGAAVAVDAVTRGTLPDNPWLRYGYELALAGNATLLAVGLVGRIGEFRDQRDRDRIARAESERLMRREAARNTFTAALQARLRSLDGGDIPMIALRLMLEHVRSQVPVDIAAVAVHGWHGRDKRLVEPPESEAAVDGVLGSRGLLLRRQLGNGKALTHPIAYGGDRAIEMAVQLPIRAPGWGLLLLQRAGEAGFTPEEIELATESAQMAVAQADQEIAAAQLRKTAEVDALTSTLNRRTFDQVLSRAFAESYGERSPLSLLFVDLDHFKSVNDNYGHACGDECLRQVAIALRKALDPEDVLGRYGGEEFVALLPGRSGAAARVIGERLRAAAEACAINWQGNLMRVTVSVGVATRLADEKTPEQTLERADKALYSAKRNGRNCVQVASAVFS